MVFVFGYAHRPTGSEREYSTPTTLRGTGDEELNFGFCILGFASRLTESYCGPGSQMCQRPCFLACSCLLDIGIQTSYSHAPLCRPVAVGLSGSTVSAPFL